MAQGKKRERPLRVGDRLEEAKEEPSPEATTTAQEPARAAPADAPADRGDDRSEGDNGPSRRRSGSGLLERARRLPLPTLLGGLALLLIGLALLLDVTVDVPWTGLLQVALILIGVALVLTGLRGGGSTGLLVGGLVLSLLLLASWRVDAPLEGGLGVRTERPTTPEELGEPYRLAAGQLTVDLTQLPVNAPVTVEASVGVGRLVVHIPVGLAIQAPGRVGGGRLVPLTDTSYGVALEQELGVPELAQGPILLTLDLTVGVGSAEVKIVE